VPARDSIEVVKAEVVKTGVFRVELVKIGVLQIQL
jgi:hypothetical protein